MTVATHAGATQKRSFHIVEGEERPLRIPLGFAEQQVAFEYGLDELNRGLADEATPEAVGQALRRIEGASAEDADALAQTFAHLQTLYRAGRNGIWTFVFRNLARPVWLSRAEQRADVVVGNPPWIVYRHLSASMKDRLREALRGYELWVGGSLATQQDMWALFWARAAERYTGAVEPIDGVAGHIPGAVNHPFSSNLRSDGRFLPPEELERRWRDRLGEASPADVIVMCGSGVTACHNLLALERAGLPGARLYAGSWSEWIRDPRRPVARG